VITAEDIKTAPIPLELELAQVERFKEPTIIQLKLPPQLLQATMVDSFQVGLVIPELAILPVEVSKWTL